MTTVRHGIFFLQGEVGQDFLASYAQLEGLCQAIISELASDRRLHDSGILPEDVFLPKITAAQYCKVPICCCLVLTFLADPAACLVSSSLLPPWPPPQLTAVATVE